VFLRKRESCSHSLVKGYNKSSNYIAVCNAGRPCSTYLQFQQLIYPGKGPAEALAK